MFGCGVIASAAAPLHPLWGAGQGLALQEEGQLYHITQVVMTIDAGVTEQALCAKKIMLVLIQWNATIPLYPTKGKLIII